MIPECVLRLVLSLILGGIIGMEREMTNRPAGLRTHILVCMGSTLTMLTSQYLFEKYNAITKLDPARMGAQVISGIGFLGAGTILKDGSKIRGLTTAASIWTVACIGLALGCGFYFGSITASVLVCSILFFLKKFEDSLIKKDDSELVTISVSNVPGQVSQVIETILSFNIRKLDFQVDSADPGKVIISVILPPNMSRSVFSSRLADVNGAIAKTEEL